MTGVTRPSVPLHPNGSDQITQIPKSQQVKNYFLFCIHNLKSQSLISRVWGIFRATLEAANFTPITETQREANSETLRAGTIKKNCRDFEMKTL